MARRDTVMKKPKDTRGTLRRMLNYLGPWRLVILGVLVLSLVSNLLNLWGPSLAGSAIREAAAGPGRVNFDAVTHYASRMLLCYLGSALLGFAISLIMTVGQPPGGPEDAPGCVRKADAAARGLFRPAPGRGYHQPGQL